MHKTVAYSASQPREIQVLGSVGLELCYPVQYLHVVTELLKWAILKWDVLEG